MDLDKEGLIIFFCWCYFNKHRRYALYFLSVTLLTMLSKNMFHSIINDHLNFLTCIWHKRSNILNQDSGGRAALCTMAYVSHSSHSVIKCITCVERLMNSFTWIYAFDRETLLVISSALNSQKVIFEPPWNYQIIKKRKNKKVSYKLFYRLPKQINAVACGPEDKLD